MDAGVSLKVVWMDDIVAEIRVVASNGRFTGTADCYCGHDEFVRLANNLRGFPTSSTDRRELRIGTFEPGFAGGGVALVLRCLDRAGHAIVELRFQAEPVDANRLPETASFSLPIEAAAIDELVEALDGVPLTVGAGARLQ